MDQLVLQNMDIEVQTLKRDPVCAEGSAWHSVTLQRETLAPLKTGGSESAHSLGRSNVVPLFRKDLANSKPVILPSIPARVVEQATIQSVCKYFEDISKTKNDQYGYLKNRVSGLVDKLEALDMDTS
ncbi:mitochondrial enolase superfamily member 1 [Grus japonensis]|uniref:Mitochondrial enolase superfamily member 1 n=1 Tax=Grus japonensis TaxID=30415 RepID=A0ABC9WRT4_GRUJA